jgi:phosphatidylserine synthase
MFLELDVLIMLYSLRNTDYVLVVPYHVIFFVSALLRLHTFNCLEPNVRTYHTNKKGFKILVNQYAIANFSHVGKLMQLLNNHVQVNGNRVGFYIQNSPC